MRLYVERGYEQTTVADIASEAGLTARTFFRYFADKREVLFAGSEVLLQRMTEALDAAPAGSGPMQAVAAGLDAAALMLGRDHRLSAQRQMIIDANAELRERELSKMVTIAAALTDGLRRRGVPERDARLAAETGVVVLRVAFEQWVGDQVETDLTEVMRATLERLSTVTTGSGPEAADG